MKILIPLGLAWLAGVLSVIAFFMSASYSEWEDEHVDEGDKDE